MGVVPGNQRAVRGALRAEVELVVTEREGGVAHRPISGDDRRALVHVRLDRALEGVARVDEEHARVGPRLLQVVHESRDYREPLELAVHVVGGDDRQRDDLARLRARRGRELPSPACAAHGQAEPGGEA